MNFVSYSQNFEDVILWRALKHIENGFYIDVGANDPYQDSVTKAFYERGWRGINIEPVSEWFEKLERERPLDINLNVSAGAEQGKLLLYEIPNTGLSTHSNINAERHKLELGVDVRAITVQVKTLTEICHEYHSAPIHFLKIDVEGMEKEVLAGLDFSVVRPWVVLIEATLPNTSVEDFKGWEGILLSADYDFVYFDGLNRFYVAKEHKELKSAFLIPPNYFDEFVLSDVHYFCRNIAEREKETRTALSNEANRSELLQSELDAVKARHQELLGELNAADANIDHLSARLEEEGQALEVGQKTLVELQARAQWLQSELDTTKTRLDGVLGELGAANASAECLSEQLEEKGGALEVSHNALAELEAHAQWLQNELGVAKARFEERLGAANANAERLSEQLEKKGGALEGSKSALQKLKANTQCLQGELEATKTRYEELLRELGAANASVERLGAQLEEKSRVLEASQSALAELEAHAQWVQGEWRIAKMKVDELSDSADHWSAAAEGLSDELQAVYKSKSWRITWPLRKLAKLLYWLIGFPSRIILLIVFIPKRISGWLLSKVITIALGSSSLKRQAIGWLNNHPKVDGFIRNFAQAKGLVPVSVASRHESGMPQMSASLSDRTQEIGVALTAALNERNRVK